MINNCLKSYIVQGWKTTLTMESQFLLYTEKQLHIISYCKHCQKFLESKAKGLIWTQIAQFCYKTRIKR